jgi:DNA-binding Lrp family transcriptional regulator
VATTVSERIRRLEARADRVAETLDPEPPDEERALELLREGVGPTVSLYCEVRTGDAWHRFDDREFDRLEATLDRWLALYAACYGVDLDGDYSVRTAAELLVDTQNVRDVATVLTGVPER